MFSTIICCVNLTENTEDIVRYTRDIAKLGNSKILIVHALPSLDPIASYISYNSALEEVVKASRARTEKYLDDLAKSEFSGFDVEKIIINGNYARKLLEITDQRCADLIIMGSMSTKNWFSVVMEKPSETVIGRSRVPVLVVPNDLNLECTPAEGF